MAKFSLGDIVVITSSLERPKPRTGTVTAVKNEDYIIRWHSDGAEIGYNQHIINGACKLFETLAKDDPNLVFKMKRR